jgi:hypothetical protein
MPIFPSSIAIGFGAAIWLFVAPARAECKDLQQFMKDETSGAEKYVDTFAFRNNHRSDSVLMLVKDTIEKGHLPKRWLFLHRDDPKSANLCVAGRGEGFGHYDDMHENASIAKFGPPGSTSPNCATATATTDASEVLREWANKALGESIILYTASRDTPGFQFVISRDRDWIIIEDQNENPKQSCFFDRGTDVFMRFNITVLQH